MACKHPRAGLIKVPPTFHMWCGTTCSGIFQARDVGMSPRQLGTNIRAVRHHEMAAEWEERKREHEREKADIAAGRDPWRQIRKAATP